MHNYQDSYGNHKPWIEIYNSSAATVDIKGCYLTDDLSKLKKYMIPKGDVMTAIKPHQHLLFWADNDPYKGTFHLNFTLDPEVSTIIARAKEAVFVADHIDYRGLGDGEGNRDRRLVIQIDPSDLPSQAVSQGWVKLVYSLSGEGWENTHFLREDSSGHKEDFKKVEVSWVGAANLPIKGTQVYVDQEQYTH